MLDLKKCLTIYSLQDRVGVGPRGFGPRAFQASETKYYFGDISQFLPCLSHIFQLPETITHPKACRVSSCEAILLCLYRLTTGNTWLVAEQVFELPAQYLALIFRETMAELWSSIKDVFRGLRHTAWLTQETLQLYADLIASMGVAGLNVCGFVDGTLLKTARPTM